MSTSRKHTTGQRLRQERERLLWSQEQLAEKIGATALSINRWEHDKAMPRPFYRAELCRVFNISAQSLFGGDEDAQEETSDLPVIWNVPHLRNLYFTGREEILVYLHEALRSRKPVALTQPQAISGLGGIGKTQTAIEYAYRYGAEYSTVLWVRADSHKSLGADFAALAALLNLPEREQADQGQVVQAVKAWLYAHSGWLLILDNADDLEVVTDFLPIRGGGHSLLTSRSQVTGPNIKGIELEKMGREEGALLLLRRAKLLAEDKASAYASQKDLSFAEAISELLDGLPLALDQAAAFVEENRCSLPDYLLLYQTRRAPLLQRRGTLSKRDYPRSVATTWSLSFEQVEQADAVAADMLRLCAFLHPDVIAEAMILEGAIALDPVLQAIVDDPMRLDDVIGELRKYSLVRRNSETRTLTIHRLVQTVLKDAMDRETQRAWAERVVRLVDHVFPESDFASWTRCQHYLPHAQVCAELIEQWDLAFPEAARLLHRTGNYLYERGQYLEAEPLYQRALSIREQVLGAQHPDVAQSLSDLGLLYLGLSKYERAEPLYQRALSIQEQMLGPHHPDVGVTVNDLAMLYFFQGKYDQVETLHQRARSIFEYALGPTHLYVAVSLNNLGKLYLAQGKYDDAEALMLRALAIREQLQHPPDIANSLSYLAKLAAAQGKYSEAEALCQRAINMREPILGPMDPQVADTLRDWAQCCVAQSKDKEAEQLFQRTIAIYEQHLGAYRQTLASVLKEYAALLRKMGRESEAVALEERAEGM